VVRRRQDPGSCRAGRRGAGPRDGAVGPVASWPSPPSRCARL
jgi:hypothetical protein